MRLRGSAIPLFLGFLAPVALTPARAEGWPLPEPAPIPPPIEAPRDTPFAGEIVLRVEAAVPHRAYAIKETIPVRGGQALTLLFPQWTPGDHAPTVPLDGLAGLVVSAGARSLAWIRDPVNVYAFHIEVPADATSIDVRYDYLVPTRSRIGSVTMTAEMLDLQWQTVVLYPAGYYARDITFRPSLTLPAGWDIASALEGARRVGSAGVGETVVEFAPTTLDVLVDSPVMAGHYFKRIPLSERPVPVWLDLAADRPGDLELPPAAITRYVALVDQAYKLFGSRHYDHYDLFLWIGDELRTYYEHHRSGENAVPADFAAKWATTSRYRGAGVHGYVHSWNGTFRRPAEMWTPNFNTPERDSLIWVFEGLTEYWRAVLSARAGLWSRADVLDELESAGADIDGRSGSAWRPLRDVNNDLLIAFRRPVSWPSWQRTMFDAYSEGALIWLDADTLISERTGGKKSLDDFARAFFGCRDGSSLEYTYRLEDVVAALGAILPYDWAGFFGSRLNDLSPRSRLDGLKRGGYRIVYTSAPPAAEAASGDANLDASIGLSVAKDGRVSDVRWGGPAFRAGIIAGAILVEVNGRPFATEALKAAVEASAHEPLALRVKSGQDALTVTVPWQGGLRYPHLERIPGAPAILDAILAPR